MKISDVKNSDSDSKIKSITPYPLLEEIANSITHGIGAMLSVAALILLVLRAMAYAPEESWWVCVLGYTIFGCSLVILYSISTLYHAITCPAAKKFFCILDHSAIYILIAGSYSAFCAVLLHRPLGWCIFTAVWTLAIIGIICYVLYGERQKWFSLGLYIFMGWIMVFAIHPLIQVTPIHIIYLLLYGGICYTLGCVFYLMQKTSWAHPVWHLFVLGGSTFQFLAAYWALPK